MKNKECFWITNFSNRNISLSDLNLTVMAFSSINLLDDRHYSYSKEQLLKSEKGGSLFNYRKKIAVRSAPPVIPDNKILFNQAGVIPGREKSTYSIKEEKYEELNMSDEVFAAEHADIADVEQPKRK